MQCGTWVGSTSDFVPGTELKLKTPHSRDFCLGFQRCENIFVLLVLHILSKKDKANERTVSASNTIRSLATRRLSPKLFLFAGQESIRCPEEHKNSAVLHPCESRTLGLMTTQVFGSL